MKNKNFKIPADKIIQVIPPKGGCIASDKITVEGHIEENIYEFFSDSLKINSRKKTFTDNNNYSIEDVPFVTRTINDESIRTEKVKEFNKLLELPLIEQEE